MPGTKVAEDVRRKQIIMAAYKIAAKSGLNAVTIRDVAARADASPGLVLFHFHSKDQLVVALLDWVLATTTALAVGDDILAVADPLDRLIALLRQEIARLTGEPARIRVFFAFWTAGLFQRDIGVRMQAELDRYREAFLPIVEAVLAAEPERFAGVTASALAAVAVSFIKGCAVQSMIAPELDIDEFLAAAEGLLAPGRQHPRHATTRRRHRRALS